MPGAQGALATLSCSSGICVSCVLHPQPHIILTKAAPHPAAEAAASLGLQQPTVHGGCCGMSLADKLYGNLSSWLALSLVVQCSWFRWILACWAMLQREAGRVCCSGLLLGAPAVFKSLYFAQPHRVWFVMVFMESGFIVPLWRCISSPSQQHLAQAKADKPVLHLPCAV